MTSTEHSPSKESLPDWLRRWYCLKGEPRFREAADEIERLQRELGEMEARAISMYHFVPDDVQCGQVRAIKEAYAAWRATAETSGDRNG